MKENTILRAIIVFVVIGIAAYWLINTYDISFKSKQESVKSEYFDERSNTYVREVYNHATGRIWMDRNLGATRVATSPTDEEAYGDLYQWGRPADGHQKRNSPTTTTLSSTDQPGHGDFITTTSQPYDWRNPQSDKLWHRVDGIFNPCPQGYRLPTELEWWTELNSWNSKNTAGAYASTLKLTLGGDRGYRSGSLNNVELSGSYWTSSVSNTFAWRMGFFSTDAKMFSSGRAFGITIRCIMDY